MSLTPMPFDNFQRPGTPSTTEEYVIYRAATLDLIGKRSGRMAKWFTENPPDIEVRD